MYFSMLENGTIFTDMGRMYKKMNDEMALNMENMAVMYVTDGDEYIVIPVVGIKS